MPMTDDERLALRKRMYSAGPQPKQPGKPRQVAAETGARTKRIVMGAVAVEVPSVEYVAGLERQLLAAVQTAEEQRRAIKRLETSLQQMSHFVRKNGRDVTDLSGKLDNKIDRRD